jgi:hypothetical protein
MDSTTNSSKKRYTFFSNFIPTKNLSIFRNKSSTTDNLIHHMPQQPKFYNSQININTEQTSIPICISRGWLKRRSQRPMSLDLDLVRDFLINKDRHLIDSRQKRFGMTIK